MIQKADRVYVVDMFEEILEQVSYDTGFHINYVYGDAFDILQNLRDKDESPEHKDDKYVLFALYMPFIERRGNEFSMLYSEVLIRRITIAALSGKNTYPKDRYERVFKPTLYPVYESFLTFFARHNNISSKDPNTIIHTKVDIFGNEPISGLNDFVDCINLDNFQFLVNQTKYC